MSNNVYRRLDALNNLLDDIYRGRTRFHTLLLDSGFSRLEITQIEHEHLNEFLQAIVTFLYRYQRRFSIGVVRHYGLIDGNPQSLEAIGHSIGVCRERVRQLISMELAWYRDPMWRARFRDEFGTTARRLLAIKSYRQDQGLLVGVGELR